MADEGYSWTALQSIRDPESPITYHLFQYNPNHLFSFTNPPQLPPCHHYQLNRHRLLCWVDGYEQNIASLTVERKDIYDPRHRCRPHGDQV